MHRGSVVAVYGVVAFLAGCTLVFGEARARSVVEDIFERDATVRGLILPDWEGYMANPAIELSISAPAGAALPVKVTIAAQEPRLYFDLPSEAGAQGPRKELTLTSGSPQPVLVAAFPARKKRGEETLLTIEFSDSRGPRGQINVPLHIVPIEGHDRSPSYPITVDFSQDRTGFFKDPVHRSIIEQAAGDWGFFLADRKLQPTPAGAEQTWIFEPDGFNRSNLVRNAKEYTGYLLYAYGIAGREVRSGGEPSQPGDFQQDESGALPIHRSGGLEIETRGNYSTRGWLPPLADQEWWKATNLRDVPNDLYSIAHHEIGHSLIFNPANRSFPRNGVLKNNALREYLGADPHTDVHDHLDGCIDPWSLHGAFGNEYHGKTPYGRWLITRTDLLAAQAIGYKLRKVAALIPLAIITEQLPGAEQDRPYKAGVEAEGGIPFYDWEISEGALPPGLVLDRFDGRITGSPRRVGTFQFSVRVRDYRKDGSAIVRRFAIEVARGPK